MTSRALIICVSVHHGNTRAVARAIAAALKADIRAPEEVDPQRLAGYDIVGFGSGIFYGSHHRRLRRYVEQLPEVSGTRAFVFTTAGRGRAQSLPWQRPLDSVLRDKGFDVIGSFACPGYDTWLPLGLVGGINKKHPDVADLTHAYEFGERLAGQLPSRRSPRRVAG